MVVRVVERMPVAVGSGIHYLGSRFPKSVAAWDLDYHSMVLGSGFLLVLSSFHYSGRVVLPLQRFVKVLSLHSSFFHLKPEQSVLEAIVLLK